MWEKNSERKNDFERRLCEARSELDKAVKKKSKEETTSQTLRENPVRVAKQRKISQMLNLNTPIKGNVK